VIRRLDDLGLHFWVADRGGAADPDQLAASSTRGVQPKAGLEALPTPPTGRDRGHSLSR
jgi:hypothetical protein